MLVIAFVWEGNYGMLHSTCVVAIPSQPMMYHSPQLQFQFHFFLSKCANGCDNRATAVSLNIAINRGLSIWLVILNEIWSRFEQKQMKILYRCFPLNLCRNEKLLCVQHYKHSHSWSTHHSNNQNDDYSRYVELHKSIHWPGAIFTKNEWILTFGTIRSKPAKVTETLAAWHWWSLQIDALALVAAIIIAYTFIRVLTSGSIILLIALATTS